MANSLKSFNTFFSTFVVPLLTVIVGGLAGAAEDDDVDDFAALKGISTCRDAALDLECCISSGPDRVAGDPVLSSASVAGTTFSFSCDSFAVAGTAF